MSCGAWHLAAIAVLVFIVFVVLSILEEDER